MPTLTGTLTAVTGGTIDTSRVRRAYVRAPQKRGSLDSEGGLVTTVPVPVPTSGELSLDLEPGPAILVVDTLDSGQDVFDLYVTADMTLITEALDEAAPEHERSWAESQMVQLRAAAVTAAAEALDAAIATGQDRDHIETLRQNLIDAAEQNAAPHLTQAALNATYGTKDELAAEAQARQQALADKLDKTEAASTYTTPQQVETITGEAVGPLVPPLVADAIAADDTPAQAAATAVQDFMASHGRATTTVDGLMPNTDRAMLQGARPDAMNPGSLVTRGPDGMIWQGGAPTAPQHVPRKDWVDQQLGLRMRPTVLSTSDDLDAILPEATNAAVVHYQASSGYATPELNYPEARYGAVITQRVQANVTIQHYYPYDRDHFWKRTRVGGTWRPWVKFDPNAGGGTAPAPSDEWVAGKAYAVGDIAVTSRGDRLRCVTAHTSTTNFTDDLPKWRAVDMPAQEPMMLQVARQAKGGGIGIGDKAAFALRFDDWHVDLHANVYPMLLARGFPAGHATIANLSAKYWADTPELVRERNRNGIETWSHGHDHNDPSPHGLNGAGGLVDQIVNSRPTIESWGVKCQGWMQPGATQLGAATPYGTSFQSIDDLNSYAGLLIRQTYPLSEMYLSNLYRTIPTGMFHGLNHITISDGMGFQDALNAVDTAVLRKQGLEVMVHSGNFDKPGNMTLAQFGQFLDHVIAYWEAGELEVLTPSGLFFADRSTSRLDLISDGSFEALLPDKSGSQWAVPTSGEVRADGGRTGPQYIRIPSGLGSRARQRYTYLKHQQLAGETFLFEGWARGVGGETASNVTLVDYQDSSRFNLVLTRTGIGTEWTRVRHAFTIPPVTDQLEVQIGRASGAGIDWDDVSVLKV